MIVLGVITHVVPVEFVQNSSIQPTNTDPVFAVAVKVMLVVPTGNAAVHCPGQLIPAGTLVITPVPFPKEFTVRLVVPNVAVTLCAADIVTVHSYGVSVTGVHGPVHPVNPDPVDPNAVSVTTAPEANVPEHPIVLPVEHSMYDGAESPNTNGSLNTDPLPVPAVITVNVKPVVGTVPKSEMLTVGLFGSVVDRTRVPFTVPVGPPAAGSSVTKTEQLSSGGAIQPDAE
jgi:hypothetical protein